MVFELDYLLICLSRKLRQGIDVTSKLVIP
jgi:hypothetical protein